MVIREKCCTYAGTTFPTVDTSGCVIGTGLPANPIALRLDPNGRLVCDANGLAVSGEDCCPSGLSISGSTITLTWTDSNGDTQTSSVEVAVNSSGCITGDGTVASPLSVVLAPSGGIVCSSSGLGLEETVDVTQTVQLALPNGDVEVCSGVFPYRLNSDENVTFNSPGDVASYLLTTNATATAVKFNEATCVYTLTFPEGDATTPANPVVTKCCCVTLTQLHSWTEVTAGSVFESTVFNLPGYLVRATIVTNSGPVPEIIPGGTSSIRFGVTAGGVAQAGNWDVTYQLVSLGTQHADCCEQEVTIYSAVGDIDFSGTRFTFTNAGDWDTGHADGFLNNNLNLNTSNVLEVSPDVFVLNAAGTKGFVGLKANGLNATSPTYSLNINTTTVGASGDLIVLQNGIRIKRGVKKQGLNSWTSLDGRTHTDAAVDCNNV